MRRPYKTRLQRFCWKAVLAIGMITGFSSACLAQDAVTGQVHNQTRKQAAANDDVILFRVEAGAQPGMVEEAHSQTDAAGSFAFKLPSADSSRTHGNFSYVVRVVHQGVNYDVTVPPPSSPMSAAVNVDVFDVSSRAEDVAGTIEIIRAGTVGKMLHVSDMVEIQNQSNPPVTQAGERSFDVYLPAHAKISSVLAAGPGNAAATMITATSASGDSGHYLVNFPLRPGATKFAVNYDVPYDGKLNFQTRHSYSLQEFAVMIPPTMKFSSSSNKSTTSFKTLPTGNENYRVQAIGALSAGAGPEFEISGTGSLPSIRGTGAVEAHAPVAPSTLVPPQSLVAAASASPKSSTSAASSPLQQPSSPASVPWILGILGALLVATSAVAIRGTPRKRAAGTSIDRMWERPSTSFLDGLKDELFQLEAARARGTISIEEYARSRRALEETVRRVLLRPS